MLQRASDVSGIGYQCRFVSRIGQNLRKLLPPPWFGGPSFKKTEGKGSEWRLANRHRQLQTRTINPRRHATPPPHVVAPPPPPPCCCPLPPSPPGRMHPERGCRWRSKVPTGNTEHTQQTARGTKGGHGSPHRKAVSTQDVHHPPPRHTGVGPALRKHSLIYRNVYDQSPSSGGLCLCLPMFFVPLHRYIGGITSLLPRTGDSYGLLTSSP